MTTAGTCRSRASSWGTQRSRAPKRHVSRSCTPVCSGVLRLAAVPGTVRPSPRYSIPRATRRIRRHSRAFPLTRSNEWRSPRRSSSTGKPWNGASTRLGTLATGGATRRAGRVARRSSSISSRWLSKTRVIGTTSSRRHQECASRRADCSSARLVFRGDLIAGNPSQAARVCTRCATRRRKYARAGSVQMVAALLVAGAKIEQCLMWNEDHDYKDYNWRGDSAPWRRPRGPQDRVRSAARLRRQQAPQVLLRRGRVRRGRRRRREARQAPGGRRVHRMVPEHLAGHSSAPDDPSVVAVIKEASDAMRSLAPLRFRRSSSLAHGVFRAASGAEPSDVRVGRRAARAESSGV